MIYAAAMSKYFRLAAALSVFSYIYLLFTAFTYLLIPIGIAFCWSLLILNNRQKEYSQRELELIYEANHDPLTGLLNRSGYTKLVTSMIQNSRDYSVNFALIYVDLDDFKQVNDTYGHFIGDKVLVEVAVKLKDLVRNKDFVSRLGGDEFAVIISSKDLQAASTTAEIVYTRIAELASDFSLECIPHKLTASIGVTVYPSDGPDLLNHADEAMYKAKKSGKHKFVFYSSN